MILFDHEARDTMFIMYVGNYLLKVIHHPRRFESSRNFATY